MLSSALYRKTRFVRYHFSQYNTEDTNWLHIKGPLWLAITSRFKICPALGLGELTSGDVPLALLWVDKPNGTLIYPAYIQVDAPTCGVTKSQGRADL